MHTCRFPSRETCRLHAAGSRGFVDRRTCKCVSVRFSRRVPEDVSPAHVRRDAFLPARVADREGEGLSEGMTLERAKQAEDLGTPEAVELTLWSDVGPSGGSEPAPAETVRVLPRKHGPKGRSGASSLDGLPLMLTVEEAAEVLRIGRTSAYKLIDLYRRTDGREGLPHVRLGGRVLVRRVDVAQIVGTPPGAA